MCAAVSVGAVAGVGFRIGKGGEEGEGKGGVVGVLGFREVGIGGRGGVRHMYCYFILFGSARQSFCRVSECGRCSGVLRRCDRVR